jgi:DNA-binding transcriptional regulator LsrR (DeoR family)
VAERPGPTQRPAELVRAAAIARRYYLDARSKLEIAEEFGLSRFKVARILEAAKAQGIVRIQISLPADIDAALSDELASAFGLRRAVVVSTAEDDQAALRPRLGQVLADLVSELVVEGDVLGMAWGRTLGTMSSQLTRLAPCDVVQLNGVSTAVAEGSVELVRQVANVSSGQAFPIYAPLVVSDPSTAETLRNEPGIAAAFRRHDEVTKAVVGIGSWEPPSSTVYDAVDEAERRCVRELGICAEVCAILVNESGVEVPNNLAPRILGISGEKLKAIPEVIAAAGGRLKANAIAAVLRGGFVSTLVTDATAARMMLEGEVATTADH